MSGTTPPPRFARHPHEERIPLAVVPMAQHRRFQILKRIVGGNAVLFQVPLQKLLFFHTVTLSPGAGFRG